MAKKKAPKPNGRPKAIVNWSLVNKLLHIQCTDAEIAGFLDLDIETIQKHCKLDKGRAFSEYSKSKRENGKISLRRRLWQAALTEDSKYTAALLFACKTLLGLKEYDAPAFNANININTQVVDVIEQLESPQREVTEVSRPELETKPHIQDS